MPYPDNIGLDHRVVVMTAPPTNFVRIDSIMPSWLMTEIISKDIPILDGYLFSIDNKIEITHGNSDYQLDTRPGVGAELFDRFSRCPMPYLDCYKKTFIRSVGLISTIVTVRIIYGPYRL